MFEQFLIVPYAVGSALALGIEAGSISKLPNPTMSEVLSRLVVSVVGSWIYVGISVSTILLSIDKKTDEIKKIINEEDT